MRVLVVEDEVRVASFLQKGLKEAGYIADIATNADNGDYLVSCNDYDLILLDWLMPDVSGLELCRQWRKNGLKTPIIMLTCKEHTTDLVTALDNGVDDYIVKPFLFSELLARIRAMLRRASRFPEKPGLQMDDLKIELTTRNVTRGESTIVLSAREFTLLHYLIQNAEKVVTKTEISEHVWGTIFQTNTNILEVYINRLRNKLNCGSKHPLIHTVRGVGYIMRVMNP